MATDDLLNTFLLESELNISLTFVWIFLFENFYDRCRMSRNYHEDAAMDAEPYLPHDLKVVGSRKSD